MARMNNYSTRPSALPFLTSIPENIPWAVLQASNAVHEVHPYSKAVPVDQIIGSLGTYLDTFKLEAITIKKYRSVKFDDVGVHSDLFDVWVMGVYPLVLPHNVKRSI